MWCKFVTPNSTAIIKRICTNILSDWLSCLYLHCSVLKACLFDHVLCIHRVSSYRMKFEEDCFTFLIMIYLLSLKCLSSRWWTLYDYSSLYSTLSIHVKWEILSSSVMLSEKLLMNTFNNINFLSDLIKIWKFSSSDILVRINTFKKHETWLFLCIMIRCDNWAALKFFILIKIQEVQLNLLLSKTQEKVVNLFSLRF